MGTIPFEAHVRPENGIAVIDLFGEINSAADEALNAAYDQAADASSRAILLNFKSVDYINSSGIALIVGLMAQARKSGRRLMATGLSDHYKQIFQITRLADFMTLLPDEASAMKEVKIQA